VARDARLLTLSLLQVTIYGVGKTAVQFHVEHDGKVDDGWWHVTNLRVSDTGKITFEDAD
jgi:predicted ATPase